MTFDVSEADIVPPVTAGRVRGIARTWLRKDAPPKALAELEALATWLDAYHAALRVALNETNDDNPPECSLCGVAVPCRCGRSIGR